MGVWSIVTGKLSHKAPHPTSEESAPAPPIPYLREKPQKYPNKLSKPKTNTSVNLLSVPGSANASKKASLTNLEDATVRRSSSVPGRHSPEELDLQHSQTLGERRLQTTVSVTSANSQSSHGEVGRGRGRPLEREGKEKKGRLSHLFRSRSSQAVPPDAKAVLKEMLQEEMPITHSQAELDALAARTANPLHRYSSHARPPFALTQQGGFPTSRDSTNGGVNRASSYAAFHTHGINRLSLVPEQLTPLSSPGMERDLQLQHISETENILTGRADSNAPRRQSMLSITNSYQHDQSFNPSRTSSIRLDPMTRNDSLTRLDSMTSENSDTFMPPPIRRKSLMTPGIATRVEDPKFPPPRQPVARRMSFQQPPDSVSTSNFFTKIRRSQTLPSDAEAPEYYESDEFPRESPMEVMERLKPLEKPVFERSVEMKRVHTPNDLGHIGGFQLGSLRITNGEASPNQTPRVVETKREVDYFHLQRAVTAGNTVSDSNVRSMRAISTTEPVALRALSPERAPRPPSKSHSFSFEGPRAPTDDAYDDSRITELRPPPFSTTDLAESYRLELDFTSPFMEYEQFGQISGEVETGNTLPELTRETGGVLATGIGRRQGDELFLPQNMRGSIPQYTQENKQLQNESGLLNAEDGALKTDSGYSSHASLMSLQEGTQRPAGHSPAPPTVPEKSAPQLPRKDSYVAYSAKSVRSMDSDRTRTGAMSPLPTEPEAPETPPKESKPKADFWNWEHVRKTPRPISKVEDLTRKPIVEVQAEPARMAPQTPQQERELMHEEPTPRPSTTRPPIPRSFFVEPQNGRESSDTAVGGDRDPITVVRYTSVKEGPRPALTDVKPRRQSTQKVLQKAIGRPPTSERMGRRNSHGSDLTQRMRSSSSDSLQSLRNMISGGSRRGSRSNSIDRGASGPPAVQKVEDIEKDYEVPPVPKGALKERTNRFSIVHAKNLWADSEEVKMERESEKADKEAEKAQKEAEKSRAKDSRTAEKEKVKEDKEKVKAEKREKKAMPPSAAEIEMIIRRRSLPAATRSERAFSMLSHRPNSAQHEDSDRPVSAATPKTDAQIRKEFEQEITSFENVAGSLGASPYELAMKASLGHQSRPSSVTSVSTIKPQKVKRSSGPQRDPSGRVIGMDEASASQFARNRSQIRAMEQERREALMRLRGAPPALDADERQRQKAFVPQIGNSNFAKQLAAQAGKTIEQKAAKAAGGASAPVGAPPMPPFNVEELKSKPSAGRGRGGKQAIIGGGGGPPVSALNGVRKKNSAEGRHGAFPRHRELSTQIEMPERFAPQPPSSTASEGSSVEGSDGSVTTPLSQPESATSVSSAGWESGAGEGGGGGGGGKGTAAVRKPKMMVSLFPNTAPSSSASSGIDGILDAVLAPMTPRSPLREAVRMERKVSAAPLAAPFKSAQKQHAFGPGEAAHAPASPEIPILAVGAQTTNIFNTRPPPPVSPAFSSATTTTATTSTKDFYPSSSPSASNPQTHTSSPPVSPIRPRLQSALSSRSSVGSSPSSFHTATGSGDRGSPGGKKRVAISTAPPSVVLPRERWDGWWKGPSPKVLADMAGKGKGPGAGKEEMAGVGGRPRSEKRSSGGMLGGGGAGSKLRGSVEA